MFSTLPMRSALRLPRWLAWSRTCSLIQMPCGRPSPTVFQQPPILPIILCASLNSIREAHHISGSIVALAAQRGVDLDAVPLADMQAIEPSITAEVIGILKVENAVAARRSFGGMAPAEVSARIADAKKRFHIDDASPNL